MWDYKGIKLPRGCVVFSELTDHELRRLELAAAAQAGSAPLGPTSSPARSVASTEYLQAFCEFMHSQGFNAMGSCTFSDKVAYKRFILSPLKAVQVVAMGIRNDCPFRGHLGFHGKLFVTPEWHRTGREVPHVHFALKTAGNPETCCAQIRSYLSNTFGRSTCEVMRDRNAGTLYGLKDTLKETAVYPNAYFLALRDRGR